MKLKEINDKIMKAKNNKELLAIVNEVSEVGIKNLSDLEIKKDHTGSDIFFNKDGNRMYIMRGKEIYEYALTVPYLLKPGTVNYIGKIEEKERR